MPEIFRAGFPARSFRLELGIQPGVPLEDFFQLIAVNAVNGSRRAHRRAAHFQKLHVVQVRRGHRNAHVSDALRAATHFEAKAIFTAREILRTGHRDKPASAQLSQDRFSYLKVCLLRRHETIMGTKARRFNSTKVPIFKFSLKRPFTGLRPSYRDVPTTRHRRVRRRAIELEPYRVPLHPLVTLLQFPVFTERLSRARR